LLLRLEINLVDKIMCKIVVLLSFIMILRFVMFVA